MRIATQLVCRPGTGWLTKQLCDTSSSTVAATPWRSPPITIPPEGRVCTTQFFKITSADGCRQARGQPPARPRAPTSLQKHRKKIEYRGSGPQATGPVPGRGAAACAGVGVPGSLISTARAARSETGVLCGRLMTANAPHGRGLSRRLDAASTPAKTRALVPRALVHAETRQPLRPPN
jgi:hypothetical protein